MSIFLGAKGGDILAWRSVVELVKGLQGTIGAGMANLLPRDELLILQGIQEKLDQELAEEQLFATAFADLVNELERADFEDELPGIQERFSTLAAKYFQIRGSVLALNSLTTSFQDALVRKILLLAERSAEPASPGLSRDSYCCFIGDAAGRREQTLWAACEFFLIYRDADSSTAPFFDKLAYRIMATMKGCGLMDSPADTPPLRRLWRGPVDAWRTWLTDEYGQGGEHRLELLSRIADLRAITGDGTLSSEIHKLIKEFLRIDPSSETTRHWARKGVGMPVALGLFGGFRVERTGRFRGCFDLEQYALAPLVMNVRILATGFWISASGTIDRIRGLQSAGRISVDLAERLLLSFHGLVRLKARLEMSSAGKRAGLYFNPDTLTEAERHDLKASLELVVNLQKLVHQAFLEYV